MPEIRLRRQVRLVFRKGGERSHAASAFLAEVEESKGRGGKAAAPGAKGAAAGPAAGGKGGDKKK